MNMVAAEQDSTAAGGGEARNVRPRSSAWEHFTADPVVVAVPPSSARSHPDEHESNSSDPPPSLSNDLASFRPSDYDMQLQPTQLSQQHYQHSSPTTSYPPDLPPTPVCDPPPPASPQHCIDPPPSVQQTDPPPPQPSTSNDLPLPSMPCPPSQFEEEIPDREHGREKTEKASKHLARLIALHGYDPSVVNDDCFRSFVGIVNPDFKLPSCPAVEEMCDSLFDEAREDLLSKLSRSPGKVSLAVATTKTIHGEVLYTACHFIDDEWNLHKMVLDAFLVAPIALFYGPLLGVPEVTAYDSNYHELDARNILQGIFDCDILDRLFFMVWAINKKGRETRQCLMQYISADCGYPIDLVFQTTAEPFFLLNPNFTMAMYREVHNLGLTREKRQVLFSDNGLDHIRAYDLHWYSCYCSLELLRKHGSYTIADRDYSQLIELLCNIWGRIHRATQRISASTNPTSNECLVEVFNVRELLESELQRTDRDNSILYEGSSVFLGGSSVTDVLTNAKDSLDSDIENSYLRWSVPLVLDPRYKLKYIKFTFSRAFGSKGARYTSEVTRKIKKLYADYDQYDSVDSDVVETDADVGLNRSMEDLHTVGTAACRAGPLGQPWDKYCRSRDGRTDDGSYFDAEKELDRYLKDPRETATEGFDILNWWKVNSWRYPTVARMARDALAMPTCSKLSSEQMAHVSSIVRGYSKKKYMHPQYTKP